MLRENWNFKNDIGMRIESRARSFFGDVDQPKDKIYHSDWIENGHFVEVMLILIRAKTDYDLDQDKIDEFIVKCAPYLGKRANEIPNETAQAMFDEFIRIYD